MVKLPKSYNEECYLSQQIHYFLIIKFRKYPWFSDMEDGDLAL